MAKQYYLPNSDEGRALWLETFAATVPAFAAKYGIAAAQVAGLTADAAAFRQVLAALAVTANFSQQLTAYKNGLRNGLPAGQVPVVPTLPAIDLGTGVLPGILHRSAAVVQQIKSHLQYTEADGQALDIIGADQTANRPDAASIKPVIQLRLASGGQVEVVWKKSGHSALEIQVDRGDGLGWQLLAVDTQPHYVDTHALPAPGQSAKWTYRALYRDRDEPVGQWSDAVSIAVAG